MTNGKQPQNNENMTDQRIERILVSAEQIRQTVQRVAGRINACYTAEDRLLALVILEGARTFANDLLARLDFPVETAHLGASSYHGGTQSSGHVELKETQALPQRIAGRQVLLIDDIYDTGLTLDRVTEWVRQCNPAGVRTCVLLEKDIPHQRPVPIDFLGLKIEDAFVIGYGLDYEGRCRELPYIAVPAT